ncbi:MAG: hypothetical protein EBR86_04605 [Planctomycetia bacterium]|nr:hypothetical protein [Planctomycetia bacterium]
MQRIAAGGIAPGQSGNGLFGRARITGATATPRGGIRFRPRMPGDRIDVPGGTVRLPIVAEPRLTEGRFDIVYGAVPVEVITAQDLVEQERTEARRAVGWRARCSIRGQRGGRCRGRSIHSRGCILDRRHRT